MPLPFFDRWNHFDLTKRILAFSAAIFFIGLLAFTIINSYVSPKTILFTGSQMSKADLYDIKNYLDSNHVPYTQKIDNTLLIPKEYEQPVRSQLVHMGLPKGVSKGFELLDSSTWLKGEKELQFLEMRALKGQLEHDLTLFDNIHSASVILDIPATKPFSSGTANAKASVILDLRPGAQLTLSELYAITSHLSGAVRGLTPNMIAVSDTTGRLYQSLDPDAGTSKIRQAEQVEEDRLLSKINAMLATLVGFDHFYTNVQVVMKEEDADKPQIDNISVGILIDRKAVKEPVSENEGVLQKDVENQLSTLLKGYGVPLHIAIDVADFAQPHVEEETLPLVQPVNEVESVPWVELSLLATALVIVGIYFWPLSRRRTVDDGGKDRPPSMKSLEELIDTVDQKMNQEPDKVIQTIKNWLAEDQQ